MYDLLNDDKNQKKNKCNEIERLGKRGNGQVLMAGVKSNLLS